jgi:hypothetical protein
MEIKMRDSDKREYTKEWIQTERAQPMYDDSLESFNNKEPIEQLSIKTRDAFYQWVLDSKRNTFTGFDAFPIHELCLGCTHYIDDLYIQYGKNNIGIFEGDYSYHKRLNPKIQFATLKTIQQYDAILISLPFSKYADIHPDINQILDICYKGGIPVHIDCAWFAHIKDITFDFNHPAIETFCISLSKAGMNFNRIALRFSRIEEPTSAITILNQSNMLHKELLIKTLNYFNSFEPDYFWNTYEDSYYKVCKDFDLKPIKIISLAKQNEKLVGLRPLIRSIKR